MSNTSENPTVPVVTGADARRLAIDLYRTTDLDVAAIAAQVGVSRLTVVRWLRREGISFGPNADKHPAAPIGQDALRVERRHRRTSRPAGRPHRPGRPLGGIGRGARRAEAPPGRLNGESHLRANATPDQPVAGLGPAPAQRIPALAGGRGKQRTGPATGALRGVHPCLGVRPAGVQLQVQVADSRVPMVRSPWNVEGLHPQEDPTAAITRVFPSCRQMVRVSRRWSVISGAGRGTGRVSTGWGRRLPSPPDTKRISHVLCGVSGSGR